MTGATPTARLFFALWPHALQVSQQPQDRTRKQLARLAKHLADQYAGRCIRPEQLHLTLVFIGEVDGSVIPVLREVGARVQCASFKLLLDKLHCWGKGKIIAAGVSQPCSELSLLAQAVRDQLDAAGVGYDTIRFVPHVTLVRNASREPRQMLWPELIAPITWQATHWSLVQSSPTRQGSSYQSLADWALTPPDIHEPHCV